MKLQTISAAALLTFALTACAKPTSLSTETKDAVCAAWAGSLFWPSRQDTEVTAVGLNLQHDLQDAACR